MLAFSARRTSASEAGDYYHLMFEVQADSETAEYLIIGRQFEMPDWGCCFIETRDPKMCGHFRVKRARLSRNCIYVAWTRGEAQVQFAANDKAFAEIRRIMAIMIPTVELIDGEEGASKRWWNRCDADRCGA